ncbi:MAG: hypothetical protein QM783_07725 [Phycisphaerales bacterium]
MRVPISALTPNIRGEMLELLSRHFEGVDADGFDADLANKSWTVLVRNEAGTLAGFSTFDIRDENINGATYTVVHSGDTIVDPSAWSSTALPRAWIGAIRTIRPHHPERPLLWLLLTSGVRTYRLLTTFWREFIPGGNVGSKSPITRRLLDTLASRRYGPMFDHHTGIVRLDRPQRLRPHLAAVPEGRSVDPHVAFFLRANPGHAAGDELVCLASLDDDNLTRAGRRMVANSAVEAAV